MQAPIVTWPGGIGNPAGEKIVTSGGRRRSTTRRNGKNRKQTRKNRSCRRNRGACTRRNRRS